MTITFRNCIADGNGGDGFRIGADAQVVLHNVVTTNNAAGVRMHPSADVSLSNVQATGNREDGFIVERFEDFLRAFPELQGIAPDTVKAAAVDIARADPIARESALKQSKLYGILSSARFVGWASLLVALAQLGNELLKYFP